MALDLDPVVLEKNILSNAFQSIINVNQRKVMPLREFVKHAWPVVEPATTFIPNWHIDCMCEHLEAVDAGQIRRLIVNIPPRHMKSILTTIMWPAWSWTKAAYLRMLFCSYSASLSTTHSTDRRNLINSDWYRERWGNYVRLRPDQNQKMKYENTARGIMLATSTGGSATGFGADRLIIDDIMNPLEAESDTERRRAVDFYGQTLSTRLNDKKTGTIVVIEQRLHIEDLTGSILAAEQGWTHLDLQAVAEAKTVISFPISGEEKVREEGDVLWPEREGPAELERQKKTMGSRAFSAQFLMRPVLKGGDIIKRGWWRFYKVLPDELDIQIQSWDLSFKDSKDNSKVVGQVWGKRGARIYLIDQVRDNMDFPATIMAILALTAKHPKTLTKIVEDKANGPAVIATLQTRVQGIIPVKPEGDKVSRASAVTATIEAGNVHLPDPSIAPWVNDFINECSAFPHGAFDDQVDTMSQALLRLSFYNAGPQESAEELTDAFGIAADVAEENEGEPDVGFDL